MTKTELEKYRKKLMDLAQRLKADEAEVRGEALRQTGGEARGNLSNAPMHLADLGSDNFEQETALGLLENERGILQQTADAIGRIDEGTFGRCQECGGDIPKERLDAVPYTPHCVDCAHEQQRGPATDAIAEGNL